MNPPKYTAIEYINFLIATQKAYSCKAAERVQQITESTAADDAINRLLHRLEPDPNELWQDAEASVELEQGILVVDDRILDKWYAKKMGKRKSAMVG
ncbi:hypothetical protein QUA56_11150 [Microcoleus sp. N3A4]|uniref:hypothetical protein n=1 Tax=Microcoleus sp. N3A4 TaxID=3055379 RepID=UPI002FD2A0C2